MKVYWCSMYIYHEGVSTDKLLKFLILPYLNSLKDRQWLSHKYFFIRYLDPDPHVRLRIEFKQSGIEEKAIKYLKFCLRTYIKNHSNDAGLNNSIYLKKVKYRRETGRYGGHIGIRLAESLFKSSTDCVLQAIATDRNWGFEKAFAISLLFSLVLVRACGMKRKECREFFSFVQERWRLTLGLEKNQIQQKLETRFSSDATNPLFASLWNLTKMGPSSEAAWLDSWKHECKEFAKLLDDRIQKQHLAFSSKINDFMKREYISPKWFLLLSLVHMTNNRVGIGNIDELYQAHVIRMCV